MTCIDSPGSRPRFRISLAKMLRSMVWYNLNSSWEIVKFPVDEEEKDDDEEAIGFFEGIMEKLD